MYVNRKEEEEGETEQQLQSYLKDISSDYGSNKERNVHLKMRNLKQTELHRLKNRGKKG